MSGSLRRMGMRSLTLLMLLVARTALAQPPAESGIARDARAGVPLACLHVMLVDSADSPVAHTVTDSAGTFVLVAPAPGVYRVGFEIFGWERLVGPVDTLREGELRERSYPLDFTRVLRPDSASPADMLAALRRREGSAWRSAAVAPPDAPIRYPKAMIADQASGGVIAQYIVDESGRARADSWRPIESSHGEFLAALRAYLPAMRYEPARLDGQPVCQLVRNHVRFDWAVPVPYITLFN